MKLVAPLGALAVTLLLAGAAHADTFKFAADLGTGSEVTPPDTTGANPTGGAVFLYDDQTKLLCGRIEYDGLTGDPTGMHVHQAPKGMPGANGSATDKVVIPIAASPVTFKVVLNDAWATSLMAGEIYTNVHTAKNPDGEIRGTMDPCPECAEVVCPEGNPLPLGVVDPGTDAGTDAGGTTSSSSSSSSSSSGSSSSDDPSKNSSSGHNGPDGGNDKTDPTPPADGGCNTSSSAPTNALSIGLLLGMAAMVIARVRRKR